MGLFTYRADEKLKLEIANVLGIPFWTIEKMLIIMESDDIQSVIVTTEDGTSRYRLS